MWQFEQSPRIDLPDVTHCVAQINQHTEFFHPDIPVVVGRAPGHIPIMGSPHGSQSICWTLATATFVAAQPDSEPKLTIWNLRFNETEAAPHLVWPIETIMPSEAALDYADAHTLLAADTHQQWSACVAGVLVVLQRERGLHFAQGLRLLVASDLPSQQRFGATAALIGATMSAVCAVYDLPLDGSEMASLCHKVEREVVGNLGSIAGYVTAVCAEQDQLLSFDQQSAESPVSLPLSAELSLWGIDTGSSRTDDAVASVAALMGYHIIAELAHTTSEPTAISWANVPPSAWLTHYREHLPPMLDGATFQLHYGDRINSMPPINMEQIYPVRQATEHLIYEQHRAQLFRAIMQDTLHSVDSARLLGELMHQSHISYRVCGGVADEADRLVTLVRNAGEVVGLYSARVGDDNTVVVFGHRDAEEALSSLIEQYRQETEGSAQLLTGSSPGAMALGVFWLLHDTSVSL
ncbi:MAG: hypothetical protein AAGF95_29635 [Chloroflexota bacterium]